MLKGSSLPLSRDGKSSLVPAPPWHCYGDYFVIEYFADPAGAARFLPDGVEVINDAVNAAIVFTDWQVWTPDGDELLDPVRAQHRGAYVCVACTHRGVRYNRTVLMWVDKAMPLARGWVEGVPKKPGEIAISRAVAAGKGGPHLAAGERFVATLSTYDRRIIDASITLREQTERAPDSVVLPYVNTRFLPAWDPTRSAFEELVVTHTSQPEWSAVWRGVAIAEFLDAPGEELSLLVPQTIASGYIFSTAYTTLSGSVL